MAALADTLPKSAWPAFEQCHSLLWRSFVFMAAYPFAPSHSASLLPDPNARSQELSWSEFARATAFCAGRDQRLLAVLTTEMSGIRIARERTDNVRDECFFRGLALGDNQFDPGPNLDVADVLAAVQPIRNEFTQPIFWKDILQIARSLGISRFSLDTLYLPKADILMLVDLVKAARLAVPTQEWAADRLSSLESEVRANGANKLYYKDIQGNMLCTLRQGMEHVYGAFVHSRRA